MTILITGANRGLGLSLVQVGLESGHQVFAGSRNLSEENVSKLKDLQLKFKDQLKIILLDVTDEENVADAAQHLNDELDVIINNAGVLNERNSSIEELDIEATKLAFDINTFGPMRVVKHFLPLLKKGRNQSIINISSDSASLTNPSIQDYSYGMSKAALNMLSIKLQLELKEEGIQVLSVHPGWMHTDMGGSQAPLDPVDSAKEIYQLIEKREHSDSEHVFVAYQGKQMKI